MTPNISAFSLTSSTSGANFPMTINPRFELDYAQLDQSVSPQKRVYALEEVKDRLEKVAFDIVRFKDGDKAAELWQVQKADDGQFIVALYQEDDQGVEKTASTKGIWEVFASTLTNSLQISYKGDPIAKISSAKLGISPKDLSKVPSYLPEKLASNPKLVNALLSDLPESTKAEVLKKFPELSRTV